MRGSGRWFKVYRPVESFLEALSLGVGVSTKLRGGMYSRLQGQYIAGLMIRGC